MLLLCPTVDPVLWGSVAFYGTWARLFGLLFLAVTIVLYIYTLGFGLFSCYSQPTTNIRSRYMRYSKYSITEAIETSGPSPHDRILLSAINTQSCSQFHAAYLLKLSIELSHQMPVRLGRWQGKYKQGEQRNPAYLPGQQMANPKSLP
jgi:hypothetical protein